MGIGMGRYGLGLCEEWGRGTGVCVRDGEGQVGPCHVHTSHLPAEAWDLPEDTADDTVMVALIVVTVVSAVQCGSTCSHNKQRLMCLRSLSVPTMVLRLQMHHQAQVLSALIGGGAAAQEAYFATGRHVVDVLREFNTVQLTVTQVCAPGPVLDRWGSILCS
jgi:hypothetical protein